MNRKIGMGSAAANLAAVLGFAISMLLGWDFGSYFFSMFIAFSFVAMACGYAYFAESQCKLAGFLSVAFAAVYAAIILPVYFTQLTTVRFSRLTQQAAELLDFRKMGLLFNLDLLGYALMALSTFFAGMTIRVCAKPGKWLKLLLLLHGIFFVSCFLVPMLGVFKADGPAWAGVALLEFWCLYFAPIGALSYVYFARSGE